MAQTRLGTRMLAAAWVLGWFAPCIFAQDACVTGGVFSNWFLPRPKELCRKTYCNAPTMPPPLGSYVRAWENVQRLNAEEDDFVIYSHEFVIGATLGPHGRHHVEIIARHLPKVQHQVIVEACGEDALDQLRKATIIQLLSERGITDATLRVQLGRSQAEGLRGDQILGVYQSGLRNTNSSSGKGMRGSGFSSGGFQR